MFRKYLGIGKRWRRRSVVGEVGNEKKEEKIEMEDIVEIGMKLIKKLRNKRERIVERIKIDDMD